MNNKQKYLVGEKIKELITKVYNDQLGEIENRNYYISISECDNDDQKMVQLERKKDNPNNIFENTASIAISSTKIMKIDFNAYTITINSRRGAFNNKKLSIIMISKDLGPEEIDYLTDHINNLNDDTSSKEIIFVEESFTDILDKLICSSKNIMYEQNDYEQYKSTIDFLDSLM